MTMPMTIATARAPTIRRAEMPRARSTAAIATDRKSSTPWTTPQPIEPRTHSPIASESADDEQEDREDDQEEGQRTGGGDPSDLAGDRSGFRLRQVDMGHDEGHRGVPGRADLGAKSRRRATRSARRRGPRARGRHGSGSGRRRTRAAARRVAAPTRRRAAAVAAGPASDRPGSCSGWRRWVLSDDTSASGPSSHARGTLRWPAMPTSEPRRLLTAELLSIGTELTVGETRDTNAGELARALTEAGVRVARMTALPDDLAVVTDAFATALARSDLVISTGGLGPTPDDLTREAIAAACGETVAIDPTLEAWLRELWRRRDMAFPELNLKQAWRIPSSAALANPNGTAPGWFVTRPDGRVIVALPGPPREMRPMWTDEVLPRLRERGLGSRRRVADIPAGRASANRRSPSCSASRSCARPTRSSPPMPGSRRWTSASPPSADGRDRRPMTWSRRRRPRSSATSGDTCGRPATRPGVRPSGRAWRSRAGRWPSSRSAPAAASTRWSATRHGSASTNRSTPRHRRRPRTARHPTMARARTTDRRPRTLRAAGSPARWRRGRPGGPRPPTDRRHRGLHRDLDPARRPSHPAERVPDRADGAVEGGPDGGRRAARGPARGRTDRLAARLGDQAVEVRDDDPIPVEADQARVAELPEQLVHALTGAADHRGEFRLGQARPESDRAVGVGGSRLARRDGRVAPRAGRSCPGNGAPRRGSSGVGAPRRARRGARRG